MFSTKLLLAAILADFVAGQFTSTSFTVPPSVDASLKAQWCIAERNVCPDLCGGQNFIKENRCIGAEIPEFDCICSNGTAPTNIAAYTGSVPNSICVATFEQCRHDNPGSDDCTVCGTLRASDIPKGVVSSTKSTTPTATATESVDTASVASAAGFSATTTATPAAAVALAGGFSGGLFMAVMAAFGLLW